jgi:hypothetical protein
VAKDGFDVSDERRDAAVVLCRCEELTAADVMAAIEAEAVSVNDIKRRTRFGMGACQGAYCLSLLSDFVAREFGAVEALEPMTVRPPARQISLDDLARSAG